MKLNSISIVFMHFLTQTHACFLFLRNIFQFFPIYVCGFYTRLTVIIETSHFFISGMSLCAMFDFSWIPVRILTVKGTSRTFRRDRRLLSVIHTLCVNHVPGWVHKSVKLAYYTYTIHIKWWQYFGLKNTTSPRYQIQTTKQTYIVHSLDYGFKLFGTCHQATASALVRKSKQTPSVSQCHINA